VQNDTLTEGAHNMKNTILIVALFAMIALSHTLAYQDEVQEEETMLSMAGPCIECNGGLGCMTDSECEGVE
jgi:hypothetical protein